MIDTTYLKTGVIQILVIIMSTLGKKCIFWWNCILCRNAADVKIFHKFLIRITPSSHSYSHKSYLIIDYNYTWICNMLCLRFVVICFTLNFYAISLSLHISRYQISHHFCILIISVLFDMFYGISWSHIYSILFVFSFCLNKTMFFKGIILSLNINNESNLW